MSNRVPLSVRSVIRLAPLLVPAHRRPAWVRQWVAEVEHRCKEGDR
jgi:hypothetical protein